MVIENVKINDRGELSRWGGDPVRAPSRKN